MALFKTANVTLALDILRIWSDDDRWDGVEPYVVPIFFKVDGERYLASLRIFHAQQPREGSTEQPGGVIQLSVDTVATGTSPNDPTPTIQEDNPLVWVPPGDLLGRGTYDSGDQVVIRDVSFTTDLRPIPFRIDILGQYTSAVEAFQGLLVALQGELDVAINLAFVALDGLIGGLFGLDEDLESCPATDLGSGDFLQDIEVQMNAMIPGTVGGVFVCMENDAFDESIAQDLRSSVKDEVAHVINDTINALNLSNTIPDPDRFMNTGAIEENIASDLTWSVIGDAATSLGAIGLSVGAIVAGSLTGGVALGLYGLVTGLSWAVGGLDDTIGVVTAKFDHSTLGPPGSLSLASQILKTEDEDDDNRWELSYTLMVNSVP